MQSAALKYLLVRSVAGLLALSATTAEAAARIETTLLNQSRLVVAAPSGRVLLVNYWATWCAPCREEMPVLDQLYLKYHAQGLDIIGISLDERADLPAVQQASAALHYPIALQENTEMRGLARVWSVPMNYLVGRAGEIAFDGRPGFQPGDITQLEADIQRLLDQRKL